MFLLESVFCNVYADVMTNIHSAIEVEGWVLKFYDSTSIAEPVVCVNYVWNCIVKMFIAIHLISAT